MNTSFYFLTISAILLCSCNGSRSKDTAIEKESYEKTKLQLRDKETSQPQVFLSVSGDNKHNLIGQTVIKASISNGAVVAVYKDVDVQLDFYSKTGALLETDKETVYETIHPGQSKSFKTKYFAPKGSDSVALKILSAKVAQ